MEHRAAGPRLGRRRFVVGGLTVGATLGLAACQGRLPSPPLLPTAASTPAVRKPQPPPEADPPPAPTTRLDVDFGRSVRLEGVSIDQDQIRPGEYLRVWLHWLANEVSQEDLRSIGRVVAANGRVVAKEDDQIGRRRNLLSRWRPGDRQVDEMRIRIAPSTPVGEYALTIAVLRPDNQTTVPIRSHPGGVALWEEDAIIVGTIELYSS